MQREGENGGQTVAYYSIPAAEAAGWAISRACPPR
jgi:hypothetical protein